MIGIMATLTPAYGRDYQSKKAVLAAFNAGNDFVYNCITSPYDGKVCNKADLGGAEVKIRYSKLTKVIVTRGSNKLECKYKTCKKMHSPNDDHLLYPPTRIEPDSEKEAIARMKLIAKNY